MKASEIVNKLKDVLLSSTEKEEETTPEVELKEEAPKAKKANKEEVKTETSNAEVKQINYSADEEPAEEATKENLEEETKENLEEAAPVEEEEKEKEESPYVTKEELSEVKAMVEKIMGMMEVKDYAKAEVPQELSTDEAPTEPLSHSPENQVSEKLGASISPNQNLNTTYGRVLKALSK
jgi:hypothetical protein